MPDDQLNDSFRQKQGAELVELPISVAKPAQISIKNPGQFDTIYFKQIKLPETLRASEVQVEVKAIGLNAKDFYALGGKVDSKEASCTLEYSGIAAIQLAQPAGAEVYTTVSTDEKKERLVKKLGVKWENIFSSRDTSFVDGLLQATNGRGVDMVLNSLASDLQHASWWCLASFGRFVEIGKRDLTDTGRVEMDQFLKNATFTAFDMSNLFSSPNGAHHQI